MKTNNKYMICPNENELAQFIEGTINTDREDFILKHLDECEKCAEVMTLALEFENNQQDKNLNNQQDSNHNIKQNKGKDFLVGE